MPLLRIVVLCLAANSLPAQVSTLHLDLDDCDDIAVDARSIYLACHSFHIPNGPPTSNMDGYAAKLDRRSGKLLYLVRLGGENLDIADRVLIDRRGNAYLTGFTGSRDFPITPNGLQTNYGGGESDAFLTVIDPDGKITYSTYFGGHEADQGDAIVWASNGDVLIGGTTWSRDFPHAKTIAGPRGNGDAFVARLHPGDGKVHTAIILGGSGAEKLTGIARSGGQVFVTGYTESADFPTRRALRPSIGGASDAFVAAFPESLGMPVWSTFLGGSGDDSSWGIATDRRGNPIINGSTESADLITTEDAAQPRTAGKSDAFVVKLNASGQKLLYATYYGGTAVDESGNDGQNIVVGSNGAIYTVGLTTSRDLAVPEARQPNYGGGEQDGFIAALSHTGKLCYGTYAGGTARYLLEGIAFADKEKMVYAVGTAIRPIEPDSPRPSLDEQYGTFLMSFPTPRSCR